MVQRHDLAANSWNPLLLGAAAVVGLVAGALIGKSGRRSGFTFRDKTVVITGGSRGLGLELARVFGREGANLVLLARNQSTLDAARNELEGSATVLAITCDVRKQQDVERAIDDAVRRFGGIDVLVNNAGVMQVGPFKSMTIEDYVNAMDTVAGSLSPSLVSRSMRAVNRLLPGENTDSRARSGWESRSAWSPSPTDGACGSCRREEQRTSSSWMTNPSEVLPVG